MTTEQRGTGLSARSAAGPGPAVSRPTGGERTAATPARPTSPRATSAGAAAPRPTAAVGPPARAAQLPSRVAVPESRVAYLSIADAARRTGASVSAVRGWARDGQVRSRTGTGPRGERIEVALADVERLTADRSPAPARSTAPARPARSARAASPARSAGPAAEDDQDDEPGSALVPLATVEAMERLSGELYLAGQRAARAEAVAELRDRRLADLQQEVEDLQREATGLWEQNQELLRRVAVAEAQVMALQQSGGAGEPSRWRLRR